MTSVPLALTVKSVKGSRAAQSCEGCAAVWTTSETSEPYLTKILPTASASRTSVAWCSKFFSEPCNWRVFQSVEASSPKK
jgi:hypothetical protein